VLPDPTNNDRKALPNYLAKLQNGALITEQSITTETLSSNVAVVETFVFLRPTLLTRCPFQLALTGCLQVSSKKRRREVEM
jgi:hypothetical protein